MNKLAESHRYLIEHEYETVFLLIRDSRKVIIGDFYGDPEIGVIDKDEQWCAVAGCGVIVYWLQEPFDKYGYGTPSPQYLEYNRNEPGAWWVESLKQVGPFELEVQLENGATHNISFQRTR